MKIELNDNEIRVALAEAMSASVEHTRFIGPEDIWFECTAGEYKDGECRDICSLRVCWESAPLTSKGE